MKTLQKQTLLYDDDCPLCQTYTSAFINYQLLDKGGRTAFSTIDPEELHYVNLSRAANEIALINTENKTVLYGIDGLLRVLGNSLPWIEKIGNWKPINYLLKKTYKFISYNRKVIIPQQKKDSKKNTCEPSFNIPYRIAYLLFGIFITTLVLFECSKMIQALPQSNYTRELLLATGQVFFQSIFLLQKDFRTILTYLGNLITVSVYGSLLLTPIILSHIFFAIPQNMVLFYFALTVGLIFMEHFRRIKILGLPGYLCITWILYRIIALYIILNL